MVWSLRELFFRWNHDGFSVLLAGLRSDLGQSGCFSHLFGGNQFGPIWVHGLCGQILRIFRFWFWVHGDGDRNFMTESHREIFLCRIHVGKLVYFGNQISDLYLSGIVFYLFDGSNFGLDWWEVSIGKDLGINWFWSIIIGDLWNVYYGLQSNLQGLEKMKSRILSHCQRLAKLDEIETDLLLETEELLRAVFTASTSHFADLTRIFKWCFRFSFLFPIGWRRFRVLGIITPINWGFIHRGFDSFINSLIWQLLEHKEKTRAATKSLILLLLLGLSRSCCLSVLFSGFCGLSFLSSLSVSLGAKMSQSSLLGKDSVENLFGDLLGCSCWCIEGVQQWGKRLSSDLGFELMDLVLRSLGFNSGESVWLSVWDVDWDGCFDDSLQSHIYLMIWHPVMDKWRYKETMETYSSSLSFHSWSCELYFGFFEESFLGFISGFVCLRMSQSPLLGKEFFWMQFNLHFGCNNVATVDPFGFNGVVKLYISSDVMVF